MDCVKIVSPDRKRNTTNQAIQVLDMYERRACRVMGQPRATQRYNKRPVDDEDFLTSRIIELATSGLSRKMYAEQHHPGPMRMNIIDKRYVMISHRGLFGLHTEQKIN